MVVEKKCFLFVLWFDVYFDFYMFESMVSGNLYGMLFVFVCGFFGFDVVFGVFLVNLVFFEWVEFLGVCFIDDVECWFFLEYGVGVSDMWWIDEEGIGLILGLFLE